MTNALPRRLLLSGLSVGAVAGLAGCGQEKIERIVPTETATADTSSAAASGSDPRKWSLYGDSFTASGFLAQELEALTGYVHISAGVAGDIAKSGAFRTGVLKLEVGVKDGVIPVDSPALIEKMNIDPNPIAASGWDYPCEIAGITGHLRRGLGEEETYFYRDAPGSEVVARGMNPVNLDPVSPTDILTEGIQGRYSLIVGFGRNELDTGIDVSETAKYINDILNTNTAENVRQMVWDVPPWSYEPLGSEARRNLEVFNSYLADFFGDKFIRPTRWILENPDEAFSKARVAMTAQDEADIEKSIIPESLRIDEWGHFNEAGARAWAHAVFQEMKKRGW